MASVVFLYFLLPSLSHGNQVKPPGFVCANCCQVVIGPDMSLPEGTVVSMHHPDEQEEEDADEFLSDDAEVGQSKEKTKQKGVEWRWLE